MMLDVPIVVHKLAELDLLRPVRQTGEWYQCYCPLHAGGNEKKPSFGILLNDQYKNGQRYPAGFSHCFACGFAGTIDVLVSKILESRQVNKTGHEWLSENVPGFADEYEFDPLIDKQTFDAINAKFAINTCRVSLSSTISNFVTESELASYRYTVPYMYERKLTDPIIAQFDVGYDAHFMLRGHKTPTPCITFPVRNRDGRTLFFCRRSIKGKLYNYPEGVTKPLYGVDQIPKDCKSLVICESCINALTSWVYGKPAVALMGTGNDYQIQQLKELGVPEFVLALDGDAAGDRATKKLYRILSSIAMVWRIRMPDGKDLNDLTKDEYITLYNSRE